VGPKVCRKGRERHKVMVGGQEGRDVREVRVSRCHYQDGGQHVGEKCCEEPGTSMVK
jgi:hypothetical protein